MLISLETSKDLEQALENYQTILLDFSASWCGPCRGLKPVLEQLSEQYKQIPFFYVDLETAESELVDYFQVQALPTVKIINNREVVYTMLGAKPQELAHALEQIVNGIVPSF